MDEEIRRCSRNKCQSQDLEEASINTAHCARLVLRLSQAH